VIDRVHSLLRSVSHRNDGLILRLIRPASRGRSYRTSGRISPAVRLVTIDSFTRRFAMIDMDSRFTMRIVRTRDSAVVRSGRHRTEYNCADRRGRHRVSNNHITITSIFYDEVRIISTALVSSLSFL
jgi:hypothetical protein